MALIQAGDQTNVQGMADARLQILLDASKKRIAGLRGEIVELRAQANAEEAWLRSIVDEINRRMNEAKAERGE